MHYSYDKADRITAVGSTTYAMNAAGNLVSRGADSFTYDQANRLKTATVGTTNATYAYDGNGVRRSKTVTGATTNYVFDTNRRLEALLDDGTNKYVWGLGVSYGVSATGSVTSMHSDALQSVRALTDGSGTLTDTVSRDAFGVRGAVDGQSTQPFDFTGELRDTETGFIYLRARLYDPVVGRFTSRDPLSGYVQLPQTQNRYAYAGGNPMSRRDPSGRDALLDPGAGGGSSATCPPELCGTAAPVAATPAPVPTSTATTPVAQSSAPVPSAGPAPTSPTPGPVLAGPSPRLVPSASTPQNANRFLHALGAIYECTEGIEAGGATALFGVASVALGAEMFGMALPVGATGVGIPGAVVLVAGGGMMISTGVYFIGSGAMITSSMCGPAMNLGR